ncbi:hypothetical protein CBR_g8247 [Chara braunii]|uniref:Uncharacterized protein n=1 Tax=Chara braunii TaxID=69332 RepID=A0A388KLM0_CHABU|nr:hypothetical protein CBR_g8247 [Chara braunii]|eukprot:GBG70946.1 hypothetical protein CBR_g8247 [Chara braunii]
MLKSVVVVRASWSCDTSWGLITRIWDGRIVGSGEVNGEESKEDTSLGATVMAIEDGSDHWSPKVQVTLSRGKPRNDLHRCATNAESLDIIETSVLSWEGMVVRELEASEGGRHHHASSHVSPSLVQRPKTQRWHLDESLQQCYERDLREKVKGKQQVVEPSSDEESVDSHESDVHTLSRKTERLVISRKRKRGTDLPIDDSPPMETPAKRVMKRRLQLGCRHQPLKKSPPYKTPLTGKRKIPTALGSVGKLRFITDNLRQLGNMNVDELKRIYTSEGMEYEGKKMQAILAIAEKRTLVAYGEEEGRVVEERVGENKEGGEEDEREVGSGET